VKHYCVKAFTEIYSDSANRYRLCCHADVNKDIEHMTVDNTLPFDFWLSSAMEKIRNDMWDGKPIQGCEGCYESEKKTGKSHRTWYNICADDEFPDEEREVITKLKNFGSTCNLGCYMCRPYDSSTRRKELRDANLIHKWSTLGLFSPEEARVQNISSSKNDLFNDNILDNIHRVSTIKIYGGEPVLLDRMWKFLEKIPDDNAKNIDVIMSTNLTQTKHKGWSLLDIDKKFHSLGLIVSCDHFGEDLEFIRYPIDVQRFEENLKMMRKYVLNIACTVSVLNIYDLKKIEEYYKDFVIHWEPVYSPSSLSIKNIPDKERVNYIPNDLVLNEFNKPASDDEYKRGLEYIDALRAHRRGIDEVL